MRALALLLLLSLAAPATAFAQQDKRPIGLFAFDIRGFYSGLGKDPVTAANLGVPLTSLPGRALGGVAGLHLYLLRRSNLAVGIGAEGVLARSRFQDKDPTTGDPVGDPITQRLRGLAPQISLNFGHRQGWSYVSAGMGPLSLSTYQAAVAPADPPPVKRTLNMGAGARWFSTNHVAFCFDLRFYLTRPEEQTISYPGRQRTRLAVISAGVSFK
jgi:hypothetical protein